MRRLLLMLALSLSLLDICNAKSSDGAKPQWLRRLPKASNQTFSYQIAKGSASTIDAATKQAQDELVTSVGMRSGVVVSIDNKTKERSSQRYENDRLTERIDVDRDRNIGVKSDDIRLFVMDVDSYWERTGSSYVVSLLVARSNGERSPMFDNVEVTTSYGVRGLWRSMIIPGWGQFYKGANLKGGMMLGGVAICGVAALYADNKARDYYRKTTQTYDVNSIRSYTSKGDSYTTIRNVAIGAAAAIYIYNLIDAIASPGARRVKVNRYRVAPAIVGDGALGVSGGINF